MQEEKNRMHRICHARADTFRAAVAILVPLIAVAFAAFTLIDKGYTAQGYVLLIRSGELSIVRQGVGWLCLLLWFLRYYPSAWSALWDGPCLILGDDEGLVFAKSGQRVQFADIIAIRFERRFLRETFEVKTSAERIVTSLIFVHRDGDAQLREIASKYPSRR